MDDIQRTIEFFVREKLWRSAGLSPMLGEKSVNLQYTETAISAMQELQKYRQIGTLEECRESREKQKAKKPEICINENDLRVGNIVFKAGTKTHKCACGSWITKTCKFCPTCGQVIDWSEEGNNG